MGEKQSTIEILKKMADQDLEINKANLDNESLRTPKLHNKWLKMLFDRKGVHIKLERSKKIMTRDKWLYYNGKADEEVYKEKGPFQLNVLKSDLSMFMDADEEFQNLEEKIARVKSELDFIERTLSEINRRSFHISNAIKALRFMNGENG